MLKWKQHALQQEILSKIIWTRIIWQALINRKLKLKYILHIVPKLLKNDVGEKHVPKIWKKVRKINNYLKLHLIFKSKCNI